MWRREEEEVGDSADGSAVRLIVLSWVIVPLDVVTDITVVVVLVTAVVNYGYQY